MFGVAEILRNLATGIHRPSMVREVKSLRLSRQDFKDITPPVLRGTLMGSLLGILPGAGHVLASFTSYSVEKRLSKTPERFDQ